jgi:hypothetical protein
MTWDEKGHTLEEVVQWRLGAKLQTDRRKQSKWQGADGCEISEYLSSIYTERRLDTVQ